jgi:hypothetical protein
VSRVEQLERQIADLNPAELAQLRDWFAEFDAERWDRQLEGDAKNGKLEKMAERALADHHSGSSTEL